MWILYSYLLILLLVLVVAFSKKSIIPFLEERFIKKYPPIYNCKTPKDFFLRLDGGDLILGYGLAGGGVFGKRFRIDPKNDSEVQYSFFCLLYVIVIPTGCWRVKIIERDEHNKYDEPRISRNGIDTEPIIKVYGTERWNIVELLYLYIAYYLVIFTCILLLYTFQTCYNYVSDAIGSL